MDTRVKFDVRAWSAGHLADVEQALSRWVVTHAPAGLGEAMRYAVLDGGKRLRPLLVMAASEAVQGNPAAALRAACAVELIMRTRWSTTTCRAWTTTCCAGASPRCT
jgi:farnesyl diphosphate synthase